MLNWLRTYRKLIVPTGLAILLVSLLFSITLHLQHRRQEEKDAAEADKSAGQETTQTAGQGDARNEPVLSTTPSQDQGSGVPAGLIPKEKMAIFSKQPSPGELINKLEMMEVSERRIEEKKLADLQVVWPLFFFSVMKQAEEMVTVMLDASEDGFGVIIITDINLLKNPGIVSAMPGDRIWIAGKIAEIDTQGTGQIVLTAEYVGLTAKKDSK
jgi:hypothetical protein